MKKIIFILGFLGLFILNPLSAQNDSAETIISDTTQEMSETPDSALTEEVMESEPVEELESVNKELELDATPEEDTSVSQSLKLKFIEGGPLFMSFVLIALILGLALSIERVASIFLQGLERSSEGVEMVEKSVIADGGVQMGLLERGLSWIGLFIALAPMLGFMGTVIGMIQAFDIIELKGEAKPDELAGGIKVALITTVSGLIVAIILQIFYNYIVSKIDSLVNQMEDASISLIDVLVKHKLGK